MYRQSGAVDWVLLNEDSQRMFVPVLEQIQQRFTDLLLIHPDDGVSRGEHLHHERRDPEKKLK